uniref:Uncharacterized protein n=1 Tax=Panagrolaimus davidi TaxID=227884 RepID=A0A914PHS8_9BILA
MILALGARGPVLSITKNETCTCDLTTAITNGEDCLVQIVNDYPIKVSGCNCLNSAYYAISEVDGNGVYTIVCYATTTTSTTTTTTLPPTTTEPPFIGACGVVKLSGNKNTYFKACFWFGGIWVVLWTFITIITNIACK